MAAVLGAPSGAPVFATSLKDLCVRIVAANFELNPTFGKLPEKYVRKITDLLPLDLPLELVGAVSGTSEQRADMHRLASMQGPSGSCSPVAHILLYI